MDERHRTIGYFVIKSLLVCSLATAHPQRSQYGPDRNLDNDIFGFQIEITSGSCVEVIDQLSKKTKINFLYDFAVVNGRTCGHGWHLFGSGLGMRAIAETLFKDADLQYSWVNEHTISIVPIHLPASQPPKKIETVLIRSGGAGSVRPSVGAEVTHFGLAEIERTGFDSTSDFVRSIPSVFHGGPAEDTYIGREAGTNSSKGCGFNLRGADAGSVVILLNGQRIAMSGAAGGWADTCNLPLDAMQSIAIMADGASLAYGTDAVSGVVNFVTRHDIEGIIANASYGATTNGGLGRVGVGSAFGHHWESGELTLFVSYEDRQALPAHFRGQATSNLTPWGGPNYNAPFGNPGTIVSQGQTYAIPTLMGRSVAATDLTQGTENLYDQWSNVDVLPHLRRLSFISTVRQDIDDSLSIWANTWLSRRDYLNAQASGYADMLQVPSTNPFYVSPANDGQPVTVLYGFGRDLGAMVNAGAVYAGTATAGANFKLGKWSVSSSVGYAYERLHAAVQNTVNLSALTAALADSNPASAFNAFGGPNSQQTLDDIRSSSLYRYYSDYKSLEASAVRSLARVPAGDLEFKIGGEFRQQTFTNRFTEPGQRLQRNLRAIYTEATVPIVEASNSLPLLRQLEVSAGAREEDYGLRELLPRAGFRWSPVGGVSVRGSWARALRPPNLPDKTNVSSSEVDIIPDPRSPNGTATALLWAGSNSQLQAERATNESLGLDFSPTDTASISATYFHITSSHRVIQPQLSLNALEDPTFQGVVLRNPTAADRNNVCEHSAFYGDVATCLSAPVDVIVDGRLQNVQKLTTGGIDLSARLTVESTLGKWTLGVESTYLLSYDQALPHQPTLELASTANNPNRFRMRDFLFWDMGRFSATTFVNYTNHYRDTNDPGRQVASWTTIDGQISYELLSGNRTSIIKATLSVKNLFNRYPPYLNNPIGVAYDQENGDLTGRYISARINVAIGPH